MSGQRVFLGQVLDVARATVTGTVQFTLKPGFREAMNAQIDGVFNEARLGSGFAAKLRGKFGWASTMVHGKCGRGAQAALIQRQFFDVSEELTLPLQQELLFHKLLHAFVGPREVPVVLTKMCFARIYSDASYEPENVVVAGFGFVLFANWMDRPKGFAGEFAQETLCALSNRAQQITPCEALLSIVAPCNLAGDIRGHDVLWFIDNQAALSCLVKGSSTCPDMARIAVLCHLMLAKLGCRVFFEYVASDDNPSDGLSRNGLLDNWSLEQNWSLDMAKQPNIAWCLKADFHDLHDWLASEFA